jgi:uncharacterized protein YyaL (SSP411 family)
MNRLAATASPYLLQHTHNPVDWFPWGEEAFAKSRADDKPIFLSIGYSACHWCHVMERESFENSAIADFLNAHFVSIKVDREERPDVDEIYMTAVQMMTGSGGWPLTVFLTPDLKPFYGGTYFPPADRYGRPGFGRLLEMILDAYTSRRSDVVSAAGKLTEALNRQSESTPTSKEIPGIAHLERAARLTASTYDPYQGGFGPAPKFPPTGQIELLLTIWKLNGNAEYLGMVDRTLRRMADGGIRDQLAGGFARYSTDAEWLVPHFEKMLYDNALLAVSYLHAYQATGDPFHLETARSTLDWALEEMRDEAGGFHSSLDADSEGVEGKFYIWTPQQIKAVLGENDGEKFCELFGVIEGGNFEHGNSILHRVRTTQPDQAQLNDEELLQWKQALLAARRTRIPPAKDDKVLTDWNALMVIALARGYRVTGDERYLNAAQETVQFIRQTMWQSDRLIHSWRKGVSGADGLLDDYSYLLAALIELYQADFDFSLLEWAEQIFSALLDLFHDADYGGFYLSPTDRTDLIDRPKSGRDGATPSGNALLAQGLYSLYLLTDRDEYRSIAEEILRSFASSMADHPTAALRLACYCGILEAGNAQLAIIGKAGEPLVQDLLDVVNGKFLPGLVVAVGEEGSEPALLKDRTRVKGSPAAYFCRNFVCQAPVTKPEELKGSINFLEGGHS